MKYRYHGKIKYTMDKEHPDVKYVDNWTEDKVFTSEDIYHIDKDDFYGEDEIIDYIKRQRYNFLC